MADTASSLLHFAEHKSLSETHNEEYHEMSFSETGESETEESKSDQKGGLSASDSIQSSPEEIDESANFQNRRSESTPLNKDVDYRYYRITPPSEKFKEGALVFVTQTLGGKSWPAMIIPRSEVDEGMSRGMTGRGFLDGHHIFVRYFHRNSFDVVRGTALRKFDPMTEPFKSFQAKYPEFLQDPAIILALMYLRERQIPVGFPWMKWGESGKYWTGGIKPSRESLHGAGTPASSCRTSKKVDKHGISKSSYSKSQLDKGSFTRNSPKAPSSQQGINQPVSSLTGTPTQTSKSYSSQKTRNDPVRPPVGRASSIQNGISAHTKNAIRLKILGKNKSMLKGSSSTPTREIPIVTPHPENGSASSSKPAADDSVKESKLPSSRIPIPASNKRRAIRQDVDDSSSPTDPRVCPAVRITAQLAMSKGNEPKETLDITPKTEKSSKPTHEPCTSPAVINISAPVMEGIQLSSTPFNLSEVDEKYPNAPMPMEGVQTAPVPAEDVMQEEQTAECGIMHYSEKSVLDETGGQNDFVTERHATDIEESSMEREYAQDAGLDENRSGCAESSLGEEQHTAFVKTYASLPEEGNVNELIKMSTPPDERVPISMEFSQDTANDETSPILPSQPTASQTVYSTSIWPASSHGEDIPTLSGSIAAAADQCAAYGDSTFHPRVQNFNSEGSSSKSADITPSDNVLSDPTVPPSSPAPHLTSTNNVPAANSWVGTTTERQPSTTDAVSPIVPPLTCDIIRSSGASRFLGSYPSHPLFSILPKPLKSILMSPERKRSVSPVKKHVVISLSGGGNTQDQKAQDDLSPSLWKQSIYDSNGALLPKGIHDQILNAVNTREKDLVAGWNKLNKAAIRSKRARTERTRLNATKLAGEGLKEAQELLRRHGIEGADFADPEYWKKVEAELRTPRKERRKAKNRARSAGSDDSCSESGDGRSSKKARVRGKVAKMRGARKSTPNGCGRAKIGRDPVSAMPPATTQNGNVEETKNVLADDQLQTPLAAVGGARPESNAAESPSTPLPVNESPVTAELAGRDPSTTSPAVENAISVLNAESYGVTTSSVAPEPSLHHDTATTSRGKKRQAESEDPADAQISPKRQRMSGSPAQQPLIAAAREKPIQNSFDAPIRKVANVRKSRVKAAGSDAPIANGTSVEGAKIKDAQCQRIVPVPSPHATRGALKRAMEEGDDGNAVVKRRA